MDRIIIIDDSGIQNELNDFINTNKNRIRLNSDIVQLSSGKNTLIKEIIESYESKHKIKIQTDDLVYFFKVNEIIYLKAHKKNTSLKLINADPVSLEGDLENYENQLKDYPFLKVHTNYIININHISHFINEDDTIHIELSNGKKIPISEYRKQIILTELEKYIK